MPEYFTWAIMTHSLTRKKQIKTSMGNIPWSKFLAAKKKTKQKTVLYIPFRKWKKSNNLGLELFGPSLISEKAMTPHSSTLAWKIPWMEEPGGLQSMGSLRVGHDWATSLSLFTFMHWRRKWQPTPVFLPRESQGWGSLVGCRLWGHTESDTTEAT